MRVLKHSLLNLRRRPLKPIMMFLIIFVVFGLVFTGVIVENSIEESKNYIRKELGGTVEYRADYMRLSADSEDMTEEEQMEAWENARISIDVANEIAKDPRVVDTFIIGYGSMQSNAYKMAKEPGQENTDVYYGDDDFAWFDFTGTIDGKPIDIETGAIEVVEGDLLNENSDPDAIMISQELAATNNLAVGDVMHFTTWMEEDTFDYTIVALYEVLEQGSNNRIYGTFDGLMLQYAGYDDYQIEVSDMASNIYFMIDDPLNIPAFIEQHESKMPSKYTVLDAADSKYEELTRPLDLMSIIIKILIGVIFVAGALIIISIVTIFVRDRKFEVGLLLASGESKGKIVVQFISEILMVAILSFVVAFGVSNLSSDFVSTWIVENQLVDDEYTMDDNMWYYGQAEVHGDVSMEEIADEFDVSIDSGVVLNLSILSLIIVLVAAMIPLIVIISYKPRRALQE